MCQIFGRTAQLVERFKSPPTKTALVRVLIYGLRSQVQKLYSTEPESRVVP